METLQEAKKYLRANFNDGSNCPCCGQFVKLYKRKLSSSMCVALIEIYHADDGNFIHVENMLKNKKELPASIRGDFAKLKYWDLIEKLPDTRADGSNRNGYYRITEKGKDFVEQKIKVNSHVFIFNNKFQGIDGEPVGIKDCLKKYFNFQELMGS